jgi:hypothetical protein
LAHSHDYGKDLTGWLNHEFGLAVHGVSLPGTFAATGVA